MEWIKIKAQVFLISFSIEERFKKTNISFCSPQCQPRFLLLLSQRTKLTTDKFKFVAKKLLLFRFWLEDFQKKVGDLLSTFCSSLPFKEKVELNLSWEWTTAASSTSTTATITTQSTAAATTITTAAGETTVLDFRHLEISWKEKISRWPCNILQQVAFVVKLRWE